MFEQDCNHSKQRRNNVATRCCGKNRRCESSRVTSPSVAGTSYQTLEVLAFCNRKRAQPSSITIKAVLTFRWKKVQWRIPGCLFFDNTRKNFKSNLVLVVVLVLESKGLYCFCWFSLQFLPRKCCKSALGTISVVKETYTWRYSENEILFRTVELSRNTSAAP